MLLDRIRLYEDRRHACRELRYYLLAKKLNFYGEVRTINEIEDALKAFKIAVEAGEVTGFKVQRLPAACKI